MPRIRTHIPSPQSAARWLSYGRNIIAIAGSALTCSYSEDIERQETPLFFTPHSQAMFGNSTIACPSTPLTTNLGWSSNQPQCLKSRRKASHPFNLSLVKHVQLWQLRCLRASRGVPVKRVLSASGERSAAMSKNDIHVATVSWKGSNARSLKQENRSMLRRIFVFRIESTDVS